MAPDLRVKTACHNYVVSFFMDKIYTTVTSDCDIVARWIREIERPNQLIVGFDIQYSPWVHLNEFVSTVQFCVGGRCLIYQLEYVDYDYPDVLLDFLANEEYTFVGLDIYRALTRLQKEHELDIPRAMVVDLRDLTALSFTHYEGITELLDYICYDAGLGDLAELMLSKGVEPMPESVMLTTWRLRRLTPEQVKHACIEAFVSFEIGRFLNAREGRLGNQDGSD